MTRWIEADSARAQLMDERELYAMIRIRKRKLRRLWPWLIWAHVRVGAVIVGGSGAMLGSVVAYYYSASWLGRTLPGWLATIVFYGGLAAAIAVGCWIHRAGGWRRLNDRLEMWFSVARECREMRAMWRGTLLHAKRLRRKRLREHATGASN